MSGKKGMVHYRKALGAIFGAQMVPYPQINLYLVAKGGGINRYDFDRGHRHMEKINASL